MPASRFEHPLSDTAYWSTQRAGVSAAHVADANAFVDGLRRRPGHEDDAIPDIPPAHGGLRAPVLSVLRDPGPKAAGPDSTGFISVFNPDQTAAQQLLLFRSEAKLDPSQVMPWNAYPWYINRAPNGQELREGSEVLAELVGRMSGTLKVILLQGSDARESWRRAARLHPGLHDGSFEVIESFHPSQQALFHADPAERERRAQVRVDNYRRVGRLVAATATPGADEAATESAAPVTAAAQSSGAGTPELTLTGPGSEQPIQDAVQAHFEGRGWRRVVLDRKDPRFHVDLVLKNAEGKFLFVEVKGNTRASSGIDVDTLYGQILRSMDNPDAAYAIAFPAAIRAKVDRVPQRVRDALRLHTVQVGASGEITVDGPNADLLR